MTQMLVPARPGRHKEARSSMRFTNMARDAVSTAHREALRRNLSHVDASEILVGAVADDSSVAVRTLRRLGIRPADLQARSRREGGQHGTRLTDAPHHSEDHVPFTAQAKRIFELAAREATRFGHDHISTGHILLGILDEGTSEAASLLVQFGADRSYVSDIVRTESSGSVERRGVTGLAQE